MYVPLPLPPLEKNGRFGLREGVELVVMLDESERSSSDGVSEEMEELVVASAGRRTT